MSFGNPMIKAINAEFRHGSHLILEDLSMEVYRGEFLGIVGVNGVGKTSLLQVLSGTRTLVNGDIMVDGLSIVHLGPRARAKYIAMVSQNPTIPVGFSVTDVVFMGRNPHIGLFRRETMADTDAVRKAIELLDLVHLKDRRIESLSGGERQRVFIARALAQSTSVLLLDEPTAHLDIAYQNELLETIRDIGGKTGLTIVAAIHDLNLVSQYCDRVAMLHDRKILGIGPPRQVITTEMVQVAFGAKVSIFAHPVGGAPVALPAPNRGGQCLEMDTPRPTWRT